MPKDNEQAFVWFLRAAEQGFVEAQLAVVGLYQKGLGCKCDLGEAFKWCSRAAEQGHAKAQFDLGVMYSAGQGCIKRDELAYHWFRKAAENGVAEAQYNLAVCLKQGRGCAADIKQAFDWYHLAAVQGDAVSQHNVAVCLFNGDGCKQDLQQVEFWLDKAAQQGHRESIEKLAQFKQLRLASSTGPQPDPRTFRGVASKHQHPLRRTEGKGRAFVCDVCKSSFKEHPSFRCEACDWDECLICYAKNSGIPIASGAQSAALPSSATTSVASTFQLAAQRIAAVSPSTKTRVGEVVALIRNILTNIIEHPAEPKFRKLSVGKVHHNSLCRFVDLVVQLIAKLDGVSGAVEFLQAAGFGRTQSNEHLLLPDTAELASVKSALEALAVFTSLGVTSREQ